MFAILLLLFFFLLLTRADPLGVQRLFAWIHIHENHMKTDCKFSNRKPFIF